MHELERLCHLSRYSLVQCNKPDVLDVKCGAVLFKCALSKSENDVHGVSDDVKYSSRPVRVFVVFVVFVVLY